MAKKPNDLLTIIKGKEKQTVTRKAYDVVYKEVGYKIEHDPADDDEPVTNDGDPEQ